MIVPSDIRHAISDGQLADYGGGAVAYMPWTQLLTAALEADVIVLAIQGHRFGDSVTTCSTLWNSRARCHQ